MRQCPCEGHARGHKWYGTAVPPAGPRATGPRVARRRVNKLEMKLMEFRLYIGAKFTGIRVIPDEKYASMWRIHAPTGEVSDMVNLTRAKDAALTWGRELTGRPS